LELYNKAVELWQSYKIASAADLDKYLDSFRILFAFHSGKIENEEITYHDTREIFENGRVVDYTGSPRAPYTGTYPRYIRRYRQAETHHCKKQPTSRTPLDVQDLQSF